MKRDNRDEPEALRPEIGRLDDQLIPQAKPKMGRRGDQTAQGNFLATAESARRREAEPRANREDKRL